MQILVLGPPRSGLSVVTRLVSMMGADMGEEGMPEGISDLTERSLKSLGLSWSGISDYDRDMFTESITNPFLAQAHDILTRFDASRPSVITEPANCLLMPFWKRFLDSPVCVHVVRSPIQVAQSLHAQYEFPIPFGIALWEAYTVEALHGAINLPSVLVSHQDLMEVPVATVEKLFNDLAVHGVRGLTLPPTAEIEASIDRNKVRARGDETLQAQFANVAQSDFFEELESGVVLASDPLPELSEGAREALTQYEAAFEPEASDTARPIDGQIHAENARLKEREKLLEEEIRATRKMTFGHEHDIADLMAWVDRLRSDVDFMENSRRWKIGDAVGRLAETFQVIPTPPLRAQDEARQVGEMYDTWTAPAMMRRQESKEAIRSIRAQAKKSKAQAKAAAPIVKKDAGPSRDRKKSVFHELIDEVLSQSPAEEFQQAFAASESGCAEQHSASMKEPSPPLVSIVMLARDAGEVLNRSIRSILDQSYQNWQLVVCDEASLAEAESLARSFHDPRIEYFSFDSQKFSSVRSQGLQRATGPIIAYLDSGNLWHPGYLQAMVATLIRRRGQYSVFSKHLDVAVMGDRYSVKYFEDVAFDHEELGREKFINLNSFMHRRELTDVFGADEKNLGWEQDWDLILKYTFLQDPLFIDAFLSLHYRDAKQAQQAPRSTKNSWIPDKVQANLRALYKRGLQPIHVPKQRKRLSILAGEVGSESFAKARSLAEALSTDFETQLIGFRFADKESLLSPPSVDDNSDFENICLDGREFPTFHKSMAKALARIRGEVIYCVEPRLPSLGLALLANNYTGAPVILDSERLEQASFTSEGFDSNGGNALHSVDFTDHALLDPCGPAWEQVMRPFAIRSSAYDIRKPINENGNESASAQKLHLHQFSYQAARSNFHLLIEIAQQEAGRWPASLEFAELYARFYEATKAKGEVAAYEVAH